jgi:two-component system, OmpR family, response regulator
MTTKRRILCVDDNEDSCEILSIVLGNAGYECVSTGTVAEALNKTSTESFDLILLDNRLPDGSGLELCQQIRDFNGDIPICFYTSDGFPAHREAAMQAGANAYLIKPVYPDELEQVVKGLLK